MKIFLFIFIFFALTNFVNGQATGGYVLQRVDGTTSMPDSSITVSKISGLKQWLASSLKTINGNQLWGSNDISVSGSTDSAIYSTKAAKDKLKDSLVAIWGSDYRPANFVAGTNYLAPNGNGSSLTGLTASQVGLGNVTNESKATMFSSPTFTGTVVIPAATVYNTPTIGTSGSAGTSHIKTVGTAPTVAQTGLGNGGSVGAAMETGSTDAAGIITLTTGNTSVGSTGTVTLTFNGAYSGNQPVIILTLVSGASAWGALATVKQTTQSLTAPVFTWNNSATGAAAALSTGTTYKIAYIIIQK